MAMMVCSSDYNAMLSLATEEMSEQEPPSVEEYQHHAVVEAGQASGPLWCARTILLDGSLPGGSCNRWFSLLTFATDDSVQRIYRLLAGMHARDAGGILIKASRATTCLSKANCRIRNGSLGRSSLQ